MLFRDRKRRLWSLALDLGGAMRVRDMCGVDMLDGSEGWGKRFANEDDLAADIIYSIAHPQIVARGLSDWKFGRILRNRKVMNAASEALVESWHLFLPERRSDEGQEPNDDGGDPFGWQEIFEYAGFVGVDPRPFTLRELVAMANGRYEHDSRIAWEPGSSIYAALKARNTGKACSADSVNPWSKPRKQRRVDFSQPRTRPLMS